MTVLLRKGGGGYLDQVNSILGAKNLFETDVY